MIARRRDLAAWVCYGGSDLCRAAFFMIPALVFRRIDALLFGALAFASYGWLSRSFSWHERSRTTSSRMV
jgi:hypothetical protein